MPPRLHTAVLLSTTGGALSLHRHLVNGYPSSTLLFINIKDKEKAAEHIRWMELAQGQALDIEYGDEIDYSKAQPLRHVIFRG